MKLFSTMSCHRSILSSRMVSVRGSGITDAVPAILSGFYLYIFKYVFLNCCIMSDLMVLVVLIFRLDWWCLCVVCSTESTSIL